MSRKFPIQKAMYVLLIMSTREGVGSQSICISGDIKYPSWFLWFFMFFHHGILYTAALHQRARHFLLYVDVKTRATKACLLKTYYTWQNRLQCGRSPQGPYRFGAQQRSIFRQHVSKRKWSDSTAWHKHSVFVKFLTSVIPTSGGMVDLSLQYINKSFYHFVFCCWMIFVSINLPVRSTEEFSLPLILFQIHFCIWKKKSTSVKKNMKSRLSSQETGCVGCLLKNLNNSCLRWVSWHSRNWPDVLI